MCVLKTIERCVYSCSLLLFVAIACCVSACYAGGRDQTSVAAVVSGSNRVSTAELKRAFEKAWLERVAGYTDLTHYGMAQSYWDMKAFIKEWKPRILRHLAGQETDPLAREHLIERMLEARSIEDLYYGLLVPLPEVRARWAAYDSIKDLPAVLDGVALQFKDGRATWMSTEYKDCEMMAVIDPHFVCPRSSDDVFAIVKTDLSGNFKEGDGSDILVNYWLAHFERGAAFPCIVCLAMMSNGSRSFLKLPSVGNIR